jgi:aspartyl-tRNA(Asn)/glutamyl-tRNA(Gln) amidotransferase subunit C
MAAKNKLTFEEVKKVAKLANLPLAPDQVIELAKQMETTLSYVSELQKVNTDTVIETSQVTGLENVFREDVIDSSRMFTQSQALANATRTYNGYFVVNAIFEEK